MTADPADPPRLPGLGRLGPRPGRSTRADQAPGRAAAEHQPVARVAVDSPLPHLDRPFDYLVPAELAEEVVPGSRVRVRFAGRLIDAWVLARQAASEHDGRLAFLERGVGAVPVLTPETARLFRQVADRYAGTFADVVRLAVPARHARAEAAAQPEPAASPSAPDPSGWSRYRAGPAFLSAVAQGKPARAGWRALPGEDWPARLAEAVQASLAGGRGAIVVVPDSRDLARVDRALAERLPAGSHVSLAAELGPETRYRRWLAVRRGAVRAVVGTRSAVFAPVADLGLVAIWDDGDDLLVEPRAPYPHTRDVAVLRSTLDGCALLLAGFAETAEAALLRQLKWSRPVVADRDAVRVSAPRIVAAGDDAELARDPAAQTARLPALAFRAARAALGAGQPVLVQVPRRGYLPTLACARDRHPARCPHCAGPLALPGAAQTPTCRWCGRAATEWRCPTCGGQRLRAVVVGSSRTAEELGRAFPGVPLRTSAGDTVLAEVPDGPAVVVATPGAEPVAAAGYGAALLLDGWALLGRPDLRAAEETLRRWCNAAALVVAGGTVVVGADPGLPAVQALIRWDPGGFAERELADRDALGFPPAGRLAALTGSPADVAELLAASQLPAGAAELGSVPVHQAGPPSRSKPEQTRTLLRVPRADGQALAEALHAAAAIRSARKSGGPVRIVLDPVELA